MTGLLQALIIIFDQKELEISPEVGLNEITFNLIFNVKKLLIISNVSTKSCMAWCLGTCAIPDSIVEKLSAADSNALDDMYRLNCYLDCCTIFLPVFFSFQLASVAIFIVSCSQNNFMTRKCDGKHLIVFTMLGFIMCISIWLFPRQLYYYHSVISLFMFRIVPYINIFIQSRFVVTDV